MKDLYGIIQRPIVTEKSGMQKELANKVTLAVDPRANKVEIKQAVQTLFNVTVQDVSVMNCTGKKKKVGKSTGRRQDWKKAVVTLKAGDTIEFFEGV